MSTWAVFKSDDGQLSARPVGKYNKFVCTFEADAQCDFVKAMCGINNHEGRQDVYWTKMSDRLDKEGL